MTFGLLAGMFLFILAAVSVAGYVFVLRPSKAETAEVRISRRRFRSTSSDLPAAQAAFVDTFQVLGDSLPLPGDRDAFRSQLIMAGYRWPAAVAIFLGIKAASAIMFGSPPAGWRMVNDVEAFAVILGVVCGLGFGYLIPGSRAGSDGTRPRGPGCAALCRLRWIYWSWRSKPGQGLDAAILDTSRGLRATHPELASEFTLLHLELKANASRADALAEFCHPQPRHGAAQVHQPSDRHRSLWHQRRPGA